MNSYILCLMKSSTPSVPGVELMEILLQETLNDRAVYDNAG